MPLQRQLYHDHYHFQRLLNCLQYEINCYEVDNGRPPKLSIILDALDYIQVYPERWHHPIEDVIFDCLLEKGLNEESVIASLKAEHKALEAQTHKTAHLFDAVAHDCVVPVAELTDEDWDIIERRHQVIQDPLFGDSLLETYENLYDHILQSEGEANASVET